MKKQKWEGQIEKVQMEYTISAGEHDPVATGPMNIMVGNSEIPIDKTDCLIAASSGILTAMLDVLWVGEFSLRYAQDVGTEQINNLVISIAKRDSISKGKRCPKNDLKSCIRYLEKEYPLASDKLTNEFGNSLNHHLRDFSHHASPFGLICSILNQFTKRGYGTDTDGRLIKPEIPATDAIGETFEGKITLGVDAVLDYTCPDGSRKRKWVSTGLTVAGNNARAAKKALADIISEYEEMEAYLQGDCLFVDYLADWLRKEKELIDISTWSSYRLIVESHVTPYFKPYNYTLTDLTPQIIQRYYDTKKESGRLDGKGGLSAKTVIQHHAVIHQTLKQALNELRIPYNPADRVRLPKKERFEGGFYTSEQIDRLLACCDEEPMRSIIMMTAFYGLRRSEVLGLKWGAVNYERQTIRICHTVVRIGEIIQKDKTKNQTSRRDYPITPNILECLKQLKAREEANRRFFGAEYQESDYIFKWEDGRPISPDYVSAKFSKILRQNNLPKIRFHDLRHSCASILIDMGFSLKDIQEWLGHADITMTGNVYGHLFNDRKVALAQQLADKMSAVNG